MARSSAVNERRSVVSMSSTSQWSFTCIRLELSAHDSSLAVQAAGGFRGAYTMLQYPEASCREDGSAVSHVDMIRLVLKERDECLSTPTLDCDMSHALGDECTYTRSTSWRPQGRDLMSPI